jgi:hypothetical protein
MLILAWRLAGRFARRQRVTIVVAVPVLAIFLLEVMLNLSRVLPANF